VALALSPIQPCPIIAGPDRAGTRRATLFQQRTGLCPASVGMGVLNRIFPAAKFMDDTLAYAKELASGPIRASDWQSRRSIGQCFKSRKCLNTEAICRKSLAIALDQGRRSAFGKTETEI